METENPIKETTAISLRKYFYEYVVIVLAAAVVSLFLMVNNLNTFIRTDMARQNTENVKIIERNTDALNTLTITQRQIQINGK